MQLWLKPENKELPYEKVEKLCSAGKWDFYVICSTGEPVVVDEFRRAYRIYHTVHLGDIVAKKGKR